MHGMNVGGKKKKKLFPVTTFGLDLFSGAHLNKLLFVWCAVIENSSVWGVHQVRCFFASKLKQGQLMKFHASLKKLDNGQSPPPPQKKKIVSANFDHALFSLLDFLTSEDGTDKLS